MEEKDNSDKYFGILALLGVIALLCLGIWAFQCNTDCQKQRNWEQQQTQILFEKRIEEQRKEQERLDEIKRNKTPEQKQLEIMQKQADSLEYLENSRKVRDTLDVIGFGLRLLDN